MKSNYSYCISYKHFCLQFLGLFNIPEFSRKNLNFRDCKILHKSASEKCTEDQIKKRSSLSIFIHFRAKLQVRKKVFTFNLYPIFFEVKDFSSQSFSSDTLQGKSSE